jgi:predicted glycoside hydrolase/deacetylase ChbG (UPF0249 family)
MRYLIVNGDDFGISQGITRGILEAHRFGILTSTSMMVNMPFSSEAAQLGRKCPELSVGLHVNLTTEEGDPVIDFDATAQCRDELQRQMQIFQELLHRLPSHLDSHHNVHRDPRLLPQFLDLARDYDLPLREHSPARYFSKFYGQWDGEVHLEQIGVESLLGMLESEVRDGITELSCHPGYIDPDFRSGYSRERETELQTLCDPRIRTCLSELGVILVGFQNLRREQGGLSRKTRAP